LHGAGRDDDGGAARAGVRDEKFQLPRLVAAQRQPGEVVALQQDSRRVFLAPERFPQPGQLVERRRGTRSSAA
jgi:hypothetical protein